MKEMIFHKTTTVKMCVLYVRICIMYVCPFPMKMCRHEVMIFFGITTVILALILWLKS